MPRPPCRYFSTRGGCRQGSHCIFSHGEPSQSGSPASNYAASSGRGRQASTFGSPPPGVCRFFWSAGKCKSEFGCRFKHINNGASNELAEQTRPAKQALDSLVPFLTKGGLAKITGSGSDAFFTSANDSLSPNEVHNHLKKFLYDDYRFRKTFDIYAFVSLLNNAHLSNPAWTSEDGQLLLDRICTGNGILRINDILMWPSVSSQAGSNPSVLSFQRGYLPLLRFLSSDVVVKSTLGYLVNALYMRIMDNFGHFSKSLKACMDSIMSAGTFKDPKAVSSSKEPMGSQVIISLATVFFECFTRFKNASTIYPELIPMVYRLQTWTDQWIAGVSMPIPTFDAVFGDNEVVRNHIVAHLKGKMDRLKSIADREQARMDRREENVTSTSSIHTPLPHEGIVAALHITFEGPGELRSLGPRHDNDFVQIHDIRIPPTHEELISGLPPFLPANLWDAPHHLLADSLERLLDIQFRLLREELTAPLRTSVQHVRTDMFSNKKTQLSDLILKHGGKYRTFADAYDSIMFNVYTNVDFLSLVPDRRGLSVNLSFDAPPGRARSAQPKARVAFWEGMSGKRLMQGGLIALVWKKGPDVAVHLGILASSLREISESARHGGDRVSVRISFFDSEVELRILAALKDANSNQKGLAVLVEAPVMFEAIRPFLEALLVEPEVIPFKQYLVHHPPGYLSSYVVAPPKYAQVPGFAFQLESLFPPEAGISDLRMVISDPVSVAAARQALRRQSRLDDSQADAVVDALTREVSLIQGPPGTGKSYTGVELLRVLLQHTRPILMIAFTNHALDHLLTSVLDAGITRKIVRLGSRSADERIAQFSIETLEMAAGQSRLDRTFGGHYRELKTVEESIGDLMKKFTRATITSAEIMQYLQIQYPEHYDHIMQPPRWISTLKELSDDDNEGWVRAGRRGKNTVDDNSLYAFWSQGSDLDFLTDGITREVYDNPSHQPRSSNEFSSEKLASRNKYDLLRSDNDVPDGAEDQDDDEEGLEPWEKKGAWGQDPTPRQLSEVADSRVAPEIVLEHPIGTRPGLQLSDLEDPLRFFGVYGYDAVPVVPSLDRPLDMLLSDGPMWSMSGHERKRLHAYWIQYVQENNYRNNMEDFRDLRKRHGEVLRKYNEGKNEIRRQLLKDVDILGCTTTGAAKLGSLLKGLDPRIMLVEEAGQVLEAHILASLVPSIEHIILIGDPQQLRPTLNNYSLSVDSKRGNQLFKFDMSLMERLSSSGFPMSQIDVQRRMRPTISNLIRTTLYPRLIDHTLVHAYPDVRGFVKNVFFLDHEHKENGGAVDDSASKYNVFEVAMIKDLVLYLLRQGCYSQEGDIVVLCTYLGQLAKVRDALAGVVAVVIDGRDQEALADREEDAKEEQEYNIEHVRVSQRVRLRTVDNYQGEEAKIVILSLVRNAGTTADEMRGHMPSIGFLKSDNRTNVALSRAKEGLFILGNSAQLSSRSHMWHKVIEELEQIDCIGDGFPIACHQHRDEIVYISEPGILPRLAPDGGCLRPCDVRLNCGHVCPYKCHPDDPDHVAVTCFQRCTKLCVRRHPCTKACSQLCGKCTFQVPDVMLPCGHVCPAVPCHLLENLDAVICRVIVRKALPSCEHSAEMECSQSPSGYICTRPCNGIMGCCSRDCKSRCHDCQVKNSAGNDDERIVRKQHVQHPCDKPLYCSHRCPNPCSPDHECITACKSPCWQQCSHARCVEYCSTPCSPCQEPCTWSCAHYSCPLPCGSVCARLPCDRRCERLLGCGHRCPSVCGENCSIQICPQCVSPRLGEQVVDLVLGRSLKEIDMNNNTSEDLLITLPNCLHVFTVETLDGVCSLTEYYSQDIKDGKWLGLKSSHERKKPPTCPTCRAAITSPRYGRAFKSADLDILERNVISRMTQQLNIIKNSLDSVSKAVMEKKISEGIRRIIVVEQIPGVDKKRIIQHSRTRKSELQEVRFPPARLETLTPANEELFDVSPVVTAVWKKVTQPLMKIYSQAAKVASTRSAHIHAWEAAYSFLYQREMDLASSDPAQTPRRPGEHAACIARMKVGQPQPRADKRFVVEAFWITLQIRFLLGDLARVLLSNSANNAACPPEQRQMWANYALFVLDTCVKDARISFETAKMSEGRRQMTRSFLFILRADLERFRLNVEIIRCSGTMASNRMSLIDTAQQNAKSAAQSTSDTIRDHLSILPNDRQDWIGPNFTETAETIVEEWYNLAKTIRADTFYQPVSLDDRMSIIKALRFSHTGHFYNCPNGHTYVITECGGAMERSQCPECGAPIGGASHALDSTNTRATEFEELAREEGATRSPWTWGI